MSPPPALSRFKRSVATLALAIATAAAALVQPPAVADAAPPSVDARALPVAAGALGADLRGTDKADLVVLFQKVEQHFYGTVWTYTVANAMTNPAHDVVVSKHVKMVPSPSLNAFAAPSTESLGTLAPYEVRWITITCTNQTPTKYCQGTGLSAKTSTPEVLLNNNSASHSF